jgi:aspartyl/asparaginyl-tRNA synthetase
MFKNGKGTIVCIGDDPQLSLCGFIVLIRRTLQSTSIQFLLLRDVCCMCDVVYEKKSKRTISLCIISIFLAYFIAFLDTT